MKLIKNSRIDFIGMRKVTLVISAIIAIIGIIGIIQIARNAANMGVDFSGGTSVQLSFAEPVSLDKARAVIAEHNLKEANLQDIKEGNKLLIKVGKTPHTTGKVSDTIKKLVQKEFAENTFVMESSTEIGPSIGTN